MTIKTGDRVRCTLGENVIVGDVRYTTRFTSNDVFDVRPDGTTNANALYSPPWQVEVIPPEIPDDIGTLVMGLGSVYQRRKVGWVHITAPVQSTLRPRTLDQLRHDLGPLAHIAIVKP